MGGQGKFQIIEIWINLDSQLADLRNFFQEVLLFEKSET